MTHNAYIVFMLTKLRKKRLIILGSIFAFLAVVVIICSTLFRLKSVNVQFAHTQMSVLSEQNSDAIIDAGKFKFGRNILFMKFDNEIRRIEALFPYAKVINIERKFPNKAIIHIAEREPAFYAISSLGHVFIFDRDLKVLNIAYDINSDDLTDAEKLAPHLVNFEFTVETLGGFELNADVKNKIETIVLGVRTEEHSLLEFSSIVFSTVKNSTDEDVPVVKMKVRDSEIELIVELSGNAAQRIANGVKVYFERLGLSHQHGFIEVMDDEKVFADTY